MTSYTKPFLDIPNLISLLKKRDMVIDDRQKASEYLQRIGYYRLSAYWFSFRKTNIYVDGDGKLHNEFHNEFKHDTRFQHIVDLYVFDKRLRLLIMDALERIEIAVRNDVILSIGKMDKFAQYNKDFFHDGFTKKTKRTREDVTTQSSQYDKWIANFQKRHRDSKEEFVAHFKDHYPDSPLPIWVAVELLHFSDLSVMYNGLKLAYKRPISDAFNIPRPTVLASWLHCFSIMRNICAHHARMWNRGLSKPTRLKSGEIPVLDHLLAENVATNRLYASAAVLCYMLRQINPNSTWPKKFKDLMQSFPQSPHISLSRNAGFPVGWESLPLWNTEPALAVPEIAGASTS